MMDQAIQNWELWLLAERRSPRTVASYLWHVRRLAAARPGVGVMDFKRRDLEHYLADSSAGWGSSMARQCVAALRGFFGYLRGGRSPARLLPFPAKRSQKLTRS